LLSLHEIGLPLHSQAGVPATVDAVQTPEIFPSGSELAIVPVEAQDMENTASQKSGLSAVFFSGGLDSFYTTLKHLAHIDQLIFVQGFDVDLENETLRAKIIRQIRASAEALGKPLIEVETNLRKLGDRHVSWDLHLFGPALASVGLLLGNSIGRIYIPSSESYAHLDPCASHPLVDPMWSTEKSDFIHDGAEATRNEKAAFIAHSETAMQTLRVCWETPGNAYNCGQRKCCALVNLELPHDWSMRPVCAKLEPARWRI